jgi:ubiquinone/menaquinone biosynthesis C-methylase UbiE
MRTTVRSARYAPVFEMRSPAERKYTEERRIHWDNVARHTDHWHSMGLYYHKRLAEVYSFVISPGQRVLELGCAQGDLLAALKPSFGIGLDLSFEMIQRAKKKHPELSFIQADAHDLPLEKTFDVVIISDLLNDLWDIQRACQQVLRVLSPRGRVVINSYSRLWELPLSAAAKLNLSNKRLPQNWITLQDLSSMLSLAEMEVLKTWQEVLWPVRTPLIDRFFNRFLVKNVGFKHLALSNFLIARPIQRHESANEKPSVSVIVPARNEAGNIAQIFERTPCMGSSTELIFVEGHSRDDTLATIEREIELHPERKARLLRQSGKGKGDAVRLGFSVATGDMLMILDADMTVQPEDLTRFYDVLYSRKGDFVSGVRLVYPMEKQAMRFFNQVGNKFFSLAFSWLLGQPVKDTLCGTKAVWKYDYARIAENRSYFGDFDPFGDFDLLFGAAKLNLKLVEVPIRYRERTYGTTNIQRWKHGWLLLRMVLFAANRIKYV